MCHRSLCYYYFGPVTEVNILDGHKCNYGSLNGEIQSSALLYVGWRERILAPLLKIIPTLLVGAICTHTVLRAILKILLLLKLICVFFQRQNIQLTRKNKCGTEMLQGHSIFWLRQLNLTMGSNLIAIHRIRTTGSPIDLKRAKNTKGKST